MEEFRKGRSRKMHRIVILIILDIGWKKILGSHKLLSGKGINMISRRLIKMETQGQGRMCCLRHLINLKKTLIESHVELLLFEYK